MTRLALCVSFGATMTDLNRRLRKLERPAGHCAGYEVIFCQEGESDEEAWLRQHPGESFPSGPLVIVGWASCDNLSMEQWAAGARGGGDG